MKLFKSKLRAFLMIVAAIAAFVLLLLLWAFVIEPNRVVIHEVQIRPPSWPASFDKFRIAAISDLHAGTTYIDSAKLDRIVALANETQPDLIVLLGDFVAADDEGRARMTPENTAARLKNLRARFGVYAVLGNHDWWFDGERVRRALESNGIRVLENDVASIQKDGQTLWLLGVPDYWTRQPIDVRVPLARINTPGPIIALTHNPDVFPELPGTIGLVLAGHTHGGQVNFPFYGRPRVASRYKERYAAGYIEENGRSLFVTTGIGTTGMAVRFRVPPEIALIEINAR